MKRLICVLFFWWVTSQLALANSYKWVDDQGKVHFSQSPPVEVQRQGNLQEIQLNSTLIRARKIDGQLYCGTLRITQGSADLLTYLITVKAQLQNARENLKYFSKAPLDGPDQQKRVHEHQCLANWAESELATYKEAIDEFRAEYRSYLEDSQAAADYGQRHCPQGESLLVGEAAREWAACHQRAKSLADVDPDRLKRLRRLFTPE